MDMKKWILAVIPALCWTAWAAQTVGQTVAQAIIRAVDGDADSRVNPTYSPDSTMIAFTRGNDLWVADVACGEERRLTSDGGELILNGYASWVYYEEILGRSSRYKAFWWSPDSRKLGFYRFDNSNVPYFPIYSPFAGYDVSAADHAGYQGSLNNTRYPKAGQANPLVRIGIVNLQDCLSGQNAAVSGGNPDGSVPDIVWADFPLMGGTAATATPGCTAASSFCGGDIFDGYFGIPFWSADSRDFYVPTLPRIQNDLNLFAVDASTGEKRLIYNEKYPTWLDWFDSMEFGVNGLYVARRFETGWDQIYFISYDGSVVRRLTDSRLWSATVLKADEKRGKLYFSAKIDGAPRVTVFCIDIPRGIVRSTKKSPVTSKSSVPATGSRFSVPAAGAGKPEAYAVPAALTQLELNAAWVKFADDAQSFTAYVSNSVTPTREIRYALRNGKVISEETLKDLTPGNFVPAECALPQLITMTTEDGFTLPAMITYPKGFNPSGAVKYPVVMEIYGGPDTPYVRDRWIAPDETNQWFAENGIIKIVCDSRAAGHSGRAGEDMVYRDVTSLPVSDFCEWADYLAALPYVDSSRIGVEGFSFGGTMTAMLIMRHGDKFRCGIAGGGVYDWALYDTHYTERYMETPQTNPEGYARACVLNYVGEYPADFGGGKAWDTDCDTICSRNCGKTCGKGAASEMETACPDCGPMSGSRRPVMLRLTHGTGDDNVHFQNTLVLIDALQKAGKNFELMIYPDGMHGYRGSQGEHSVNCDRDFWRRNLLD